MPGVHPAVTQGISFRRSSLDNANRKGFGGIPTIWEHWQRCSTCTSKTSAAAQSMWWSYGLARPLHQARVPSNRWANGLALDPQKNVAPWMLWG